MKKVIAALGITAGALLLAPAAQAETGTHQYLDILCYHPAFAQGTPVVRLNGNIIRLDTVGARRHNDYCSGPDVILPPSYGSGAP